MVFGGVDIIFDPNCEVTVDTDHPRRLVKRWRFEPDWCHQYRQRRANEKHGFYQMIEPRLYFVDGEVLSTRGPLSKVIAKDCFIGHPVYSDLIRYALDKQQQQIHQAMTESILYGEPEQQPRGLI